MKLLSLLGAIGATGCGTAYVDSPREVGTVRAVGATGTRTSFISRTGTVYAYGDQVPLPTGEGGYTVPFTLDVPSQAVAGGFEHACAVSIDGNVYCWGDQTDGVLGPRIGCPPPELTDSGTVYTPPCVVGPTLQPTITLAVDIAAGDALTCTLHEDATVLCWGDARGRGGSTMAADAPPGPVLDQADAPVRARRVVVGRGPSPKACAITLDDRAVCWGVGVGDRAEPLTGPGGADLADLGPLSDVALGDAHTCVATTTDVVCWGANRNGESGDADAAAACGRHGGGACTVGLTHVAVAAPRSLAVGARHTCAVAGTGAVTCWGSNEWGQLGRSDAYLVGVPATIDGLTVDNITAGDAHTCAQALGGASWCWGFDEVGQVSGGVS